MKTQTKILIGTGVGILLWVTTKKKLHPLVPDQYIRQPDTWASGGGKFKANRGNHQHNGIDIVAKSGQLIQCPVAGKIIRYTDVYNDGFSYSGVAIDSEKYLYKIFYLAPSVSVGTLVRPGDNLGFAQNIAAKYPGITPHVHFEIWDKSKKNTPIDPTNLF